MDIANYADDTTPYTCADDIPSVIKILENGSHILFEWFKNNYFKANPEKCAFLLTTKDDNELRIENSIIQNSDSVKLLGVNIDINLKFDEHVNSICQKVGQKLHALARISPYMSIDKRKQIMSAFIDSQFGYCPLIWMMHSRSTNNKINRLHERALRITYNEKVLSFDALLEKSGTVTIHQRNLQILATELYKTYHNLSPKQMNEIFTVKNTKKYNLRGQRDFEKPRVKSVLYGTESLRSLGPSIWNILPNEIKNSHTLSEFKNKIRKWVPKECPCRLCKVFIADVGFI